VGKTSVASGSNGLLVYCSCKLIVPVFSYTGVIRMSESDDEMDSEQFNIITGVLPTHFDFVMF
jgi:hypothetical protein